jgi:hypothetical protein
MDSYKVASFENSFYKICKVLSILFPQVIVHELEVFVFEDFELDILINVAYRFEVDSLTPLLLTFVDLLAYVHYIVEHRTSVSSVKDRREFVMGRSSL